MADQSDPCTTHPGRDSALDAYRLLAAALVVTTHYLPGFFDIRFYVFSSGLFLVAAGYASYHYAAHKYTGPQYCIERIVRLYPAFLVAVLAYGLLRSSSGSVSTETWINHLLFLLPATEKAQVYALNPPFWIMSVFVEYYLFFAIIGKKISPLPLFIGSFLLMVGLKMSGSESLAFLRMHLPYYLYVFALGGVIAKFRKKIVQWPLSFISPLSAAMLLVLILIVFGGLFHWVGGVRLKQIPGWIFYHEVCVLIQAALLFTVLYTNRNLFRSRVVLMLAQLSFSIYLFHNLPKAFVLSHIEGWGGFMVALAITLAVSLAVQSWVENPIRCWFKGRFGAKRGARA